MSMQGRIGRAGGGRVKRALGVQAILEWAFRVEKAQLELPVRRDIDEEGFGFGMEYVLIQRALLGCKVDGGGRSSQSYTHQDAEIVAATLAGMPDNLGGKRMAIYVAELARAGMAPDWLPGVVPRCVPVATKRNQHGEQSTTMVVGIERVLHRRRWRSVEVLACPVTWRPHPEQIASARRGYGRGSGACWLETSLTSRRMQSRINSLDARGPILPGRLLDVAREAECTASGSHSE